MEREKCCCFTGHRRIPEQEMLWVRRRLREEILDLAQKGVDTFLTGGALGFDTLAAQEVLRMRAMGLPSLKPVSYTHLVDWLLFLFVVVNVINLVVLTLQEKRDMEQRKRFLHRFVTVSFIVLCMLEFAILFFRGVAK